MSDNMGNIILWYCRVIFLAFALMFGFMFGDIIVTNPLFILIVIFLYSWIFGVRYLIDMGDINVSKEN